MDLSRRNTPFWHDLLTSCDKKVPLPEFQATHLSIEHEDWTQSARLQHHQSVTMFHGRGALPSTFAAMPFINTSDQERP